MATYTFTNESKEIVLSTDKCSYFVNDEERPIEGIDIGSILELLNGSELVEFHREYYDVACESCHSNRREGGKYYDYLEFHFYLFSKDSNFVMSSLSESYKDTTLPRLLKEGIVDGSYIVSINVCDRCGVYSIDIEYGLF